MADRKNPNKPPHRAQSLRHLASSVSRTTRILTRWPNTPKVSMEDLAKKLKQAQELLTLVATSLDTLPPDYPPRRISATAMIKPGVVVTIKDQYREKYELLVKDKKDLEELKVEKVNEHSLTFKTKSGLISLAPKRHVRTVGV